DPDQFDQFQAAAREAMRTPAQVERLRSVMLAVNRLRSDPDLGEFFRELDEDGPLALRKYGQQDWFLQKLAAAEASVAEEQGSPDDQDGADEQLAAELDLEEQAMRELEDELIAEIFTKFDTDKDGVLSLDEFNSLQRTTEGPDAEFTSEQLASLLLAISPELLEPGRGMPFKEFYRLYSDQKLAEQYGTDVVRDHGKIFGSDTVPGSAEVPEYLFGDPGPG
ncbi:unnamed protein product, partial [Prorocentrum cordatum]